MSAFPDSQLPTDEQKKKLCHMLFRALLEIRQLGWSGKAQQAADLADAFHELPICLWRADFSLDIFRQFLESYRHNYPDSSDYLAALDEVRKLR